MAVSSFRLSRPFFFALFVVSILASKSLQLIQHASSIPPLKFILYFPTLFIQDAVAILADRLLLYCSSGVQGVLSLVIGGVLSFFMLGTAASQIGFYYVTGSEMQLDSAASVAKDPAAIGLMMSGIKEVMVVAFFLLAIAFFCTPWLYNKTGFWLATVWKVMSPENFDTLLPAVRVVPGQCRQRIFRIQPLCIFTAIFAILTLSCFRPSRPYNHISTTLPIAVLRIFKSRPQTTHQCADDSSLLGEPFPFPELIAQKNWQNPRGHFKGWAPGTDNFLVRNYQDKKPKWLLDHMPYGFKRYEEQPPSNYTRSANSSSCSDSKEPNFYNPVSDPLRISNLDLPLYDTLKSALSSVLISNVILILAESHRKELFPIRESSHLHEMVLRANSDAEKDSIRERLRQLTPVAEQVTGESYWDDSDGKTGLDLSSGVWRDSAAPGMGGINARNAITGSTLSLKSFIGSHCGVHPMAVNFMEETKSDLYQPCIPQILQLFNNAKQENKTERPQPVVRKEEKDSHRKEIQSRPWKSVFVQAITGTYDRQNVLNQKVGMQEVVVKENLEDKSSKYYPPKSKVLNYFGYPDREARAPIRDKIMEAAQKKNRLFLSHFTSTTHHPWKVPSSYNETQYMTFSGHKDFNSYLNTIRYVDTWIGEILGMLDEAGIANETLVVVVGDHGHAFEIDSRQIGTYKNPHISNFRVPIVFRHPHLPRLNVDANVTSMSILPTILDLLVNTNSLNSFDAEVASDIIHDYQAQSILRPIRAEQNGRYQWHFGVINSGRDLVAVQSAGHPWRVIVPLKTEFQYRFTDLKTDPNEQDPVGAWSITDLSELVRDKFGEEAQDWVLKADEVTRWWRKETLRLYNYDKDD